MFSLFVFFCDFEGYYNILVCGTDCQIELRRAGSKLNLQHGTAEDCKKLKKLNK